MKHLILISGPPGAGKSHFAAGLAKRLKAVLLDKDLVDEPFSPNDRGVGYQKKIQPRSVAVLLGLARENLNTVGTVILDAPWTRITHQMPFLCHEFKKLARQNKARLTVFECVISEHKLKKRITDRGLVRDKNKLKNNEAWKDFLSTHCFDQRIKLRHVVMDVEKKHDSLIKKAVRYLTLLEKSSPR
ncbi:MAG: ATP-binding protein [Deltaproteobacteria bacterium]|nr:ATP-binding protein [Deltaproteobacteria bacterium]